MGDVMQPFPGEDKVGESLNAKRERERERERERDGPRGTIEGFLPVLPDDDKRLVHDSFHPPQTEYTAEPQEAQN